MPDRTLYPATPPLQTLQLAVGDGHVMHVQTFGRADGLPALVLHGGPGSGASPLLWRYLDPQRFHIIVPDQRGAGRSQPRGATDHNTTDHLLADLRQLRREWGVARWLVVGGSWGATLALAHAADDPAAVSGLLLRAVFLARDEDIDAFFQGAAAVRPAAWRRFTEAAPPGARGRMLSWLADSLQQPARRDAAAAAWWHWEQALSGRDAAAPPDGDAWAAVVDRYRVQAHYLMHGCWLRASPLLDRVGVLAGIETLMLHARDDLICLPSSAEALAHRLPTARLCWVGHGHDPAHPAMVDAMVRATDAFARDGHFTAP